MTAKPMGRFRWCVITLIALATVINYIDRNALAVMWPEVSKEIGATKEDYALLVTIFMIFYAFGQSIFGRIFDAIGTRMGFTISIVIWSLSIAAHALVRSMPLLIVLRATLGVRISARIHGPSKRCATDASFLLTGGAECTTVGVSRRPLEATVVFGASEAERTACVAGLARCGAASGSISRA